MSANYGHENCGEILTSCPNGPSPEIFAKGTGKFSHGSNGEGRAFQNTPQRWNILANEAHENVVGGLDMSSPKKARVNPYTPFQTSAARSPEIKQGERIARKSPVHTSAPDAPGMVAQTLERDEADISFGDAARRSDDKESSIDLPPRSLRIPSSWSTTNALGMKGNEDALSISSGEAMASSSPDQHTPNSKDSPEEEESPTDAFIRRMHEDDDFGQSSNINRGSEGYAEESDANSV